jgi:Uma2 family endonuclease
MANGALLKEQYENGRRFSYAEYKDWELAEGERYELIYGEAYAMAAPNAYHQSILMELSRQFANFHVGKPCKVYPAPYDVRLFYEEDESDDTVVQPDISVVCDPDKRGKEACHGAPDFIAEILSPSNTAIEMERKFALYREAGVREYWVLDPEHKTLSAYILKNGTIFPRTYRAADAAAVEIFPGLSIDLEPVFAE